MTRAQNGKGAYLRYLPMYRNYSALTKETRIGNYLGEKIMSETSNDFDWLTDMHKFRDCSK